MGGGGGGGEGRDHMVLLIMDSLQGEGILCRESDNVQVKIRQVTMLGATETTSGFHCFTGEFVWEGSCRYKILTMLDTCNFRRMQLKPRGARACLD